MTEKLLTRTLNLNTNKQIMPHHRDMLCCSIVAMCDLVHDVKTIFHLRLLLIAFGNILRNMSDAVSRAS